MLELRTAARFGLRSFEPVTDRLMATVYRAEGSAAPVAVKVYRNEAGCLRLLRDTETPVPRLLNDGHFGEVFVMVQQ